MIHGMSKDDGTPLTRLLSPTHAAQILDCSRTHIYGLIAAGKLRAVEIKATGTRSKTRVRRDDLERFIEDQTRGQAPSRSRPRPQSERPRIDHPGERGARGEDRRPDGT